MTVRIGWSVRRPKEPKPGQVGRHVGAFEYLKVKDTRGKHTVVGYLRYGRDDLAGLRDKGVRLDVRVFGLLWLSDDVTEELTRDAFGEVRVTGWLRAPGGIKRALASKGE